jgi:hypothetical protein
MKADRSKSVVQKPLGYPLAPFAMLRLARALRQAVERCGEAGDAALEARGKEQDRLDCIKSGEAFTHEEAGRAMQEIMRRGGSEPV